MYVTLQSARVNLLSIEWYYKSGETEQHAGPSTQLISYMKASFGLGAAKKFGDTLFFLLLWDCVFYKNL